MGSKQNKPHALCIPAPVQGHIIPMLKVAKILHSKGFLITFVNTEFNHQHLLRSRGLDALSGFPSFCIETIPDAFHLHKTLMPPKTSYHYASQWMKLVWILLKNCWSN